MGYETNYDRYKELCNTYKIAHGTYGLVPMEARKNMTLLEQQEAEEKAMLEYDIVIKHEGSGYAHTKYRVLRNTPGLSTKDLAIICDKGNLCFGYSMRNGLICVHTD